MTSALTPAGPLLSAVVGYQPRLLDAPLVGLYPCSLLGANGLLIAWGHRLGPVNRPFTSMCHVLELNGEPAAVAVAASIVSATVARWDAATKRPVTLYQRQEVVELARLAAAEPWLTRVMLRLWRQVCGPLWPDWPVKAAISYSHNAMHRGDIYRFDGWTKEREDSGSSGGGAWSRPRYATEWVWRYGARR